MPDWYVLQTITGKETEIIKALDRDGIRAFSPSRAMLERRSGAWKLIPRRMLPGYVFVALNMSVRAYHTIRATPGVLRFLGEGMPQTVPDSEMRLMLALHNDGEPWGLSEGHMTDSGLVIDTGPLVGWEDRIEALDARRYRAKVALTVLGNSEMVELAVTTKGNPLTQPGDASPEDDEGEQTEDEAPSA